MFVATGIVVSLFGSAYGLSQLIFVLPLGRYIDTGNSKYYLIDALLLNDLVVFGFIFVQSPLTSSFFESFRGSTQSQSP